MRTNIFLLSTMPNKEKKIQLPALDSGDNNHINGVPAFREEGSIICRSLP